MIKILGTTPRISTPTRVTAFRGSKASTAQKSTPKPETPKEKSQITLPGLIIGTLFFAGPDLMCTELLEGAGRCFVRGVKRITKVAKTVFDRVFA